MAILELFRHKKIYSLVKHKPDIKALDQALIDSKKLQEKGVGEKDQPSVAEPLLQSQKTQENTKCFEKHVSVANQSEASF